MHLLFACDVCVRQTFGNKLSSKVTCIVCGLDVGVHRDERLTTVHNLRRRTYYWKEERPNQCEARNQQALRLESSVTRSVNKLPSNAAPESPSVRHNTLQGIPTHIMRISTQHTHTYICMKKSHKSLSPPLTHADMHADLLSVIGFEKSLSLMLSRVEREGMNRSELKQEDESSPLRGGW